MKISNPCSWHRDKAIECYELKIESGESVDAAKSRYQCQEMMLYRRPDCPHSTALPCCQYQRCSRGEESPPACIEIVSDYVHPECGHVTPKPTCIKKRKWGSSPPRCRVPITFSRPCKCTITLECHEYIAERRLPIAPTCYESVTIERPRCLHKLSLRCHDAQSLLSGWNSQVGDSASVNNVGVVVVKYGKSYGPPESDIMGSIARCSNSVLYQQRCGHEVKGVLCCEAFEFAADRKASSRCDVKVKSKCICNGLVSLPCWTRPFVDNVSYQHKEAQHHDGSQMVLQEHFVSNSLVYQIQRHQPTPEILKALKNVCKSTVSIERSCGKGHMTKVTCGTFFGELIRCAIQGTSITLSECDWTIADRYTFSCGIHTKEVNKCNILRELTKETPPCKAKVQARLHRCGHSVSVDCCDHRRASSISNGGRVLEAPTAEESQPLVESNVIYCIPSEDVPPCGGQVRFKFDICGHVHRDISCEDAFEWTVNPPLCARVTSMVHPICSHDSEVPCYLKQKLTNWSPWKGAPPRPEYISIVASPDGQAIQLPLVRESHHRPPDLPPGVSKEESQMLLCHKPTLYHRSCGCDARVICSEAYRFKSLSECQEIKTYTCPNCHFDKELYCHDLQRQEKAGAYDPCENVLSKQCSVCKINESEFPCSSALVTCSRRVEGMLSCGHVVSWQCGTDTDPRFDDSFVCLGCEIPRWKNLLESVVTTSVKSDFFIAIRKMIERSVEGVYAIENDEPISLNLDTHIDGLVLYFRKFLDLVEKRKVRPQRAPAQLLAVEDLHKYYRVVFKPCHEVSNVSHEVGLASLAAMFSQQEPTPYGNGVHTNSFSQQQIELLKPASDGDGLIGITIGVAFCFNPCIQPPPFTAETNMKALTAEQLKRVNKKALSFQDAGFDCASIGDSNEEFVLWFPGLLFTFHIHFSLKLTIYNHYRCCC